MKNYFCIIGLLILLTTLYPTCTGVAPRYGGSSTETIGGVMVDTLNNPVGGAIVKISSKTDSTTTGFDTTDENGRFSIKDIKAGIYWLYGYTADSSLIAFIDTINYENVEDSMDLGKITMKAPGWIAGQVTLNSEKKHGVHVYIPGSSFGAFSGDSGEFFISHLDQGIYKIYYEYPGYIMGVDTGITVNPSDTTRLQLKNLLIDTLEPPPEPKVLSADYDTAKGIVILKWNPVTVDDLYKYEIFRSKVNGKPESIGYSSGRDTFYIDTVFSDSKDTANHILSYQVKSVDTHNNTSKVFSPAIKVSAVSPRNVKTFFKWMALPDKNDTIVHGQGVKIIIGFENKTRINRYLTWYTGKPLKAIETDTVNCLKGIDTLLYSWKDTGVYTIRIEAVDNSGGIWIDDKTVRIRDSAVIIDPNKWKETFSMQHSRRELEAAVINQTIYVVGGAMSINHDKLPLATVESYTFDDNTWKSCKSLDSARYAHTVVAAAGKLYVFGGIYKGVNGGAKDLTSIKQYDPRTDEWTTVGDMPSILIAPAACVINDSIYIFGGITHGSNGYVITTDINVFDPKTGKWSKRGAMKAPRVRHRAVAVNGTVYILGGIAGDFITVLSSVEIYHPGTNISAEAPNMNMKYARKNFGALEMNGTLYVIGGIDSTLSQNVIGNMESYTFTEAKWTEREPVPYQCHSFGICALNRFIFLIGGSRTQSSQTNSVFRYFPHP
ncbi:MAG: kelch repeat-containing protein [Chitinispirillia bacterium]